MSWVAVAVAGGAVVGAVASNNAAGKAAKAQENATNRAISSQDAAYQQTREDQTPWREAGMVALNQLGAGTSPGGEFNRGFTMGDYLADPGYEFRRSEGMRGIESRAAARGSLMSGGALRSLSRFNSGLASEEFGNTYNRFNNDRTQRFNRLASLAGIGQTANNNLASATISNGNMLADLATQGGNARASGYAAQGQAITNATNQVGNYAMLNSLGSRQQAPTYTNQPQYGGYNGTTAYSDVPEFY